MGYRLPAFALQRGDLPRRSGGPDALDGTLSIEKNGALIRVVSFLFDLGGAWAHPPPEALAPRWASAWTRKGAYKLPAPPVDRTYLVPGRLLDVR